MVNDKALTTGDIAKLCKVSFVTVIKWIDGGRLKAYQLPGRGDRRVEVEDFIAFLKENRLPIPGEFLADNRGWLRALVVEDEQGTEAVISQILVKLGFTVKAARDSFSAGILLRDFKPDLVTLDLMVSGINGMQVLRGIREASIVPEIKVLVIAGGGRAEMEKAFPEGADDLISKPFHHAELERKIAKLFPVALKHN